MSRSLSASGRLLPVGLNIKNEDTTALVRELARRTGLTQTGAVEDAVRARLAELDRDRAAGPGRDTPRATAHRLLDELRGCLTAEERADVKAAESQLYDDTGLPS
jgi:antitoxin VapB